MLWSPPSLSVGPRPEEAKPQSSLTFLRANWPFGPRSLPLCHLEPGDARPFRRLDPEIISADNEPVAGPGKAAQPVRDPAAHGGDAFLAQGFTHEFLQLPNG